jgi:hypothetical protein
MQQEIYSDRVARPRSFLAPRENRTAVIEPPLEDVGRLLAENVRRRAESHYDFQGKSLAELCRHARVELLAEARRWTAAYRDVELASEGPDGLILLAGHQPELFHPGVWLKNFALGVLARQHRAAAVNLVIDSDVVKSTSLLVPGGSPSDPRLEAIPLDSFQPRVPYEERRVADARLLGAFGQRVAQRIAPLVNEPLVRRYWPLVLDRLRSTDHLGYCLAQARHQLEGQWGGQTLEIPQSWVCQCESFHWFTAHILAQLPRFAATYNQAVHEYRLAERIRNEAHPVPDLAMDGPWHEAPFWIWTAAEPERRRLFARSIGNKVLVSDRKGLELALPLDSEGEAGPAVAELAQWAGRGIKIRSRALITTLWARLALGDLFIHGIGGAKYDRVTDVLAERFFGIQPPGIMVISGTLQLESPAANMTADDLRAIDRQLRELTFHPEQFLPAALGGESRSSFGGLSRFSFDENGTVPFGGRTPFREAAAADALPAEVAQLIAAKRRWVEASQTPENAHARWRAIRDINTALQPWLESRRRQLLGLRAKTAHALHARQILCSREYSFCLHQEKNVREFLEELLPKTI